MLTVRQVAERINAADSSVRVWAGRGRFPGAYVERPPVGTAYWLIPEEALDGFTMGKPGPKPAAKAAGKARAKYPRPQTKGKQTVRPKR
jgi:hypothetical protein